MNKARKGDGEPLRDRLIALRGLRERGKAANRRPRRERLSAAERGEILRKTGAKCHICGGEILGSWEADHVLAHSAGGRPTAENYLPAHSVCNNCRWDYLPDEFQLILKLGVWARTQVEKGTDVGRAIEQRFTRCESARIRRRKNGAPNDVV